MNGDSEHGRLILVPDVIVMQHFDETLSLPLRGDASHGLVLSWLYLAETHFFCP